MTGPCTEWFNKGRSECKYGGIFKYPGCCTKEKCKCYCHYVCNSKEFGRKELENSRNLNEFDNTKCTNNITSKEEGDKWRVKNCVSDRLNRTKGSVGRHIIFIERYLKQMK